MHRCALLALLAAILACSAKRSPSSESSAAGPVAAPKPPSAPPSSTPPAPPAPPLSTTAGLDLDGMDRSVSPGSDFFAYANGGWSKRTEIPPDRSSYGTGAMLAELTAKRTVELIQEAAAKAAPGTDARKVGDYYATFMDEAAIEAKGTAPLKPALAAIAAISDGAGLAAALGGTLRADVDAFNNTNFYTDHVLGLWVAQDLDEPSRYAAFLLQGGLGLPDRDYYLEQTPRMAELRDKYQAHLATLLALAGVPDGATRAKRVFELELRLARTHATRTESEDVHKGNNRWKRRDFATRAPGLDWERYFSAAGLAKQADFIVWHPSAVTGLAAAARDVPLATWKDYLAARAIDRASQLLPRAFVEERFAFYGRALAGTPKLRDRWKRAVDATSEALGEVVGRLYVERYFPASEKARAEQMVKHEQAAFARRIDAIDWMSPTTKARAKAKLAVLKVGVGYPDTWRDYSGLEIVRGDVLGNAERASMFDYRHHLAKLGKPVDRGEWVMNAHLVNAVNLPAMNAMNFPAAILQPPYFDPKRPALMDYGAAGATIGHEISHSFDDQGAMFDETGRLANWWTPEDLAHFKAAAGKLAKQFDAYRPFPDAAVDGTLTLSENIADVAGLAVAYDAYRLSLGGKEAEVAQGLTGDQQFFLSYAQSWRGKLREPAARQRLKTDSHAPAEYRALTVRNLDSWYAAFGVKPGEGLYLAPADRVRIW
ncbi:MAG TPA: M13 family metallopeptidase [Kofleriaceae bacterium]|nr:M13 family metallopeptidase [Kofleriaceae bacterium]